MSDIEDFKRSALEVFKEGYAQAPKFCVSDNVDHTYFLRALLCGQTKNRTPDEILRDAGAIKWCLEQLTE